MIFRYTRGDRDVRVHCT